MESSSERSGAAVRRAADDDCMPLCIRYTRGVAQAFSPPARGADSTVSVPGRTTDSSRWIDPLPCRAPRGG